MSKRDEILAAYDSAFGAAASGLPGSGAGWATRLRAGAMQDFRGAGFPTRRDEAWRYTDLGALQKRPYLAAGAAPGISAEDLPPCLSPEGGRIVLVNGRFSAPLSRLGPIESSVTFMSLADALDQKPGLVEEYFLAGPGEKAGDQQSGEDGIRHLNTALMTDGCVIILEPSGQPNLPLEILYLNSSEGSGQDNSGNGAAAHIRNLLVLKEGASLNLVETYRGGGDFWSNIVSSIIVGPGASLTHQQIQVNGGNALLSAAANLRIAAGGQYASFVLTAGGLVTRNEIHVLLEGEDASVRLDGLCLARAGQSLANVTIVEHQAPNASSKQRYKSILQAGASAAFLGKVVVARDAQQSEAHQASASLLLGEGATANAKPELLIHADDVKCSHGASVGALDQAALFYLHSRGLDPAAARQVLVSAFAEEIVAGITPAAIGEAVHSEVARWMQGEAEAENP